MSTRTAPVTPILARCLLALAIVPVAVAHAQTTRIDRIDADYAPAIAAQSRDGTFWATGAWSGTRNALVRYSVDGTRLGARDAAPVRALHATADGGVLLSPLGATRCEIEHHDISGATRWSYRARGVECASIAPDAAGNTWVFSRTVPISLYFSRLDRNGTLRLDSEIVQLAFEGVFTLEGSPLRAGFVVGGTRGNTAALAEFDQDVHSRWTWQLPGTEPGGILRTTIAADGSATAAGRVQRDGTFRLLDVSLNGDGSVRHFGVHDGIPADFIHAQTSASDGANWILSSDAANAMRVTRVASDGTSWSSPAMTMVCDADSPCTLRALANGEVWQVGALDGTFRTAVLRRWTTDGRIAFERSTQNTKHAYAALLANEVLLLTVRNGTAAPVFKANATGGGDRTPPATYGASNVPLAVAGATLDGAGGTFLAVVAKGGRGSALIRVAADGSERWRAATGDGWLGASAPATNGSRVCIGAQYPAIVRIECYASDTGVRLYATDVPDVAIAIDGTGPQITVQPLASGDVLAWNNGSGGSSGAWLTELDFVGGTVRRTRTSSFPPREVVIDAAGNSQLLLNGYVRTDARGVVLQGPYDTDQLASKRSWATPDSGYVVLGGAHPVQGQQFATMAGLLPDGRLNWVRRLEETGSATVRSTGDTAYVLNTLRPAAGNAPLEPTTFERIEPSSGFTRWQRSDLMPVGVRSVLATDAVTARMLVAQGWPGRVRHLLLEPVNGAVAREAFVAHAGRSAEVAFARVQADGSVRSVVAEGAPGGAALVATTAANAGTRGAIAIDQAGIAGAWYPRNAAGQGLVIDWLATSRTFFAPWFTYTATLPGTNEPAQQRWYSLQGEVAVGATRAELVIYENTGGNFDAPPATTARRVGTASIEFASCGEATLRYRFDAGTPVAGDGVIALSRLTPRSFACREADGTIAAAQADASRGGFEARQSGAWFSPATSGQGVMLTVAPGDSVFGAWFTYDDAARSDDPTRQSWVTLQAGLANATGGQVTVPLYRTAGGTFDAAATQQPATWQVGEATLTFLSCNRARLDYRFNDDEAAPPQRARTGSIALERLGGCGD